MACPNCRCQVHYQVCGALEDSFSPDDESLERCAACGHVFHIDDVDPDDDIDDEESF